MFSNHWSHRNWIAELVGNCICNFVTYCASYVPRVGPNFILTSNKWECLFPHILMNRMWCQFLLISELRNDISGVLICTAVIMTKFKYFQIFGGFFFFTFVWKELVQMFFQLTCFRCLFLSFWEFLIDCGYWSFVICVMNIVFWLLGCLLTLEILSYIFLDFLICSNVSIFFSFWLYWHIIDLQHCVSLKHAA